MTLPYIQLNKNLIFTINGIWFISFILVLLLRKQSMYYLCRSLSLSGKGKLSNLKHIFSEFSIISLCYLKTVKSLIDTFQKEVFAFFLIPPVIKINVFTF